MQSPLGGIWWMAPPKGDLPYIEPGLCNSTERQHQEKGGGRTRERSLCHLGPCSLHAAVGTDPVFADPAQGWTGKALHTHNLGLPPSGMPRRQKARPCPEMGFDPAGSTEARAAEVAYLFACLLRVKSRFFSCWSQKGRAPIKQSRMWPVVKSPMLGFSASWISRRGGARIQHHQQLPRWKPALVIHKGKPAPASGIRPYRLFITPLRSVC